MKEVDFGAYCRRVDAFDYRARRRDLPRDFGELLAAVLALEREDAAIRDSSPRCVPTATGDSSPRCVPTATGNVVVDPIPEGTV